MARLSAGYSLLSLLMAPLLGIVIRSWTLPLICIVLGVALLRVAVGYYLFAYEVSLRGIVASRYTVTAVETSSKG